MTVHPGAMQFIAAALADAVRPRPALPFADWLPRNIMLVDGDHKGEAWSAKNAPYLRDIAECLSLDHPSNLVTVRKAQQTGVSILALAWCLYIADTQPDNILYGVPGIDALKDINGQKLQPLIDAWEEETGKSIIIPLSDRSGRGSTIYEKRFPGGYISLANANVIMDLSMKTVRYGVKDEVSKWQELANGSDPETLFFGRFTAFRRTRNYKIFELSTPELDTGDELGEAPGHCRIDRSFKRSDQRYFFVTCPHCDEEFVQSNELFVVDRTNPAKSYMRCPSNGCVIEDIDRVPMIRGGKCKPTKDGPDRHPGFHVDAFCSLMMSYEAIAEDFLSNEKRGEPGAKDYANLICALPFEMRGNAPDYLKLHERAQKSHWERGTVPHGGLILTGGADVQHNGIFAEAVAFAQDRQSWCVDYQFFAGDTDDKNAGAWPKLDAWRKQTFRDAHGNERVLDALAVDAGDGNRVTQVLEWCRERPDTYAIVGRHGRGQPPISIPQNKAVTKRGKRKRFGKALAWPVGTWTLKSELYGNLHKDKLDTGGDNYPGGYCHFADWCDEEYFKQLTAEYFRQEMVNGRFVEEWKKARSDNHMLDARVYAMAMAEHMGLSRLTEDGWAQLRQRYETGPAPDLLSAAPVVAATVADAPKDDRTTAKPGNDRLAAIRNSWMNR